MRSRARLGWTTTRTSLPMVCVTFAWWSLGSSTPRLGTLTLRTCRTGLWPVWPKMPRCNAAASCPATAARLHAARGGRPKGWRRGGENQTRRQILVATPGPVRLCPACGAGRLSIGYGERADRYIGIKFIVLDVHCKVCGWSGHIEPDVPEWEGDRWRDTRAVQLL